MHAHGQHASIYEVLYLLLLSFFSILFSFHQTMRLLWYFFTTRNILLFCSCKTICTPRHKRAVRILTKFEGCGQYQCFVEWLQVRTTVTRIISKARGPRPKAFFFFLCLDMTYAGPTLVTRLVINFICIISHLLGWNACKLEAHKISQLGTGRGGLSPLVPLWISTTTMFCHRLTVLSQ